MAGYSAGEALVLTQLQAITGNPDPWTSSNTSRANWKILNGGKSDHYGILVQGEAAINPGGFSTFQTQWQTIIQVWQRYTIDSTTQTNLQALVAAIVTRFEQYRKLQDTGGTILDSKPVRIGKPEEMWARGGNGPSWLKLDIVIQWTEEETVTYAE